jgi:predicted Zn-dependent protease
MFLTPTAATASLSGPLRETTYSFRRLTPAEAATLQPLRLRVVTVRSGDTPQTLASRMAYHDDPLNRFLVLNGLEPGARLQPGQLVKIVTE